MGSNRDDKHHQANYMPLVIQGIIFNVKNVFAFRLELLCIWLQIKPDYFDEAQLLHRGWATLKISHLKSRQRLMHNNSNTSH